MTEVQNPTATASGNVTGPPCVRSNAEREGLQLRHYTHRGDGPFLALRTPPAGPQGGSHSEAGPLCSRSRFAGAAAGAEVSIVVRVRQPHPDSSRGGTA